MARTEAGIHNEQLKAALVEALAGQGQKLEELLARYGITPSGKPSLKLAAAFGAEVERATGPVAKLLSRLAADDAAPDTDRVFLPVAAAYGFAARIRQGLDVDQAWATLGELAADERSPVRVGTLDALTQLALSGFADELVAQAELWLDSGNREISFGSAALAIEVFSVARVIATLREPEALLSYLARTIDVIADAPRAAERLDARRRALLSLSQTLATVVIGVRGGDRGLLWLEAECLRASHPDVRKSMSDAVDRLREGGQSARGEVIERLRSALATSAKPLREAARVRPGTGRGKASRRSR